jgi:LacI family transcriptional regulator
MCGLRVPNDLSVVGFDDVPFAALTSPGLTTVRQPVDSMGHYAAGALLDRIASDAQGTPVAFEPPADSTVVFPPTLVVRESVCPRRS